MLIWHQYNYRIFQLTCLCICIAIRFPNVFQSLVGFRCKHQVYNTSIFLCVFVLSLAICRVDAIKKSPHHLNITEQIFFCLSLLELKKNVCFVRELCQSYSEILRTTIVVMFFLQIFIIFKLFAMLFQYCLNTNNNLHNVVSQSLCNLINVFFIVRQSQYSEG